MSFDTKGAAFRRISTIMKHYVEYFEWNALGRLKYYTFNRSVSLFTCKNQGYNIFFFHLQMQLNYCLQNNVHPFRTSLVFIERHTRRENCFTIISAALNPLELQWKIQYLFIASSWNKSPRIHLQLKSMACLDTTSEQILYYKTFRGARDSLHSS